MPKKFLAVPGNEILIAESLRNFKAEVFAALAHPTRIQIVEILSEGEQSVGSMIDKLKIEPSNASQHLAILRSKKLVVARKDGNQVIYSLRDEMLSQVLAIMKIYFQKHLEEAFEMLKEIEISDGVR